MWEKETKRHNPTSQEMLQFADTVNFKESAHTVIASYFSSALPRLLDSLLFRNLAILA